MAILICPIAKAEANKAFYTTLEQALSKYLTIQPRMVRLLVVPENN
jgi:hypothetical protein